MRGITLFIAIALFITACGENKETTTSETDSVKNEAIGDPTNLKSDIESLKSFFASQTGKKLDVGKATEMIEKSQQFAKAYPDDPIGGAYLFTAGEVARSIGQYEEAVNIFTKVESDYPAIDKAPDTLFMKAFTFEENIKNKDLARKYYQEFLTKYSDHARAKDVKQLIEVIGLSPEELIRRFKQQNQQ